MPPHVLRWSMTTCPEPTLDVVTSQPIITSPSSASLVRLLHLDDVTLVVHVDKHAQHHPFDGLLASATHIHGMEHLVAADAPHVQPDRCHHFPFRSFTRSALTHTLPSPLNGSTSTS